MEYNPGVMGRGPEMAVSIGQQVRKNGIEVVALIQQPEPDPYAHVIPGSTAWHEAKHIVVAKKRGKGVKGATITPNHNQGYDGATFVDSFDGPSFMAAHAEGHSGTGHDVAVTVFMGRNPSSDASVARDILNENREAVGAIASALEVSKSLGRSDIDAVIGNAEKRKEPKATVIVKTEAGERNEVKDLKVHNGIVVFDAKKHFANITQDELALAG